MTVSQAIALVPLPIIVTKSIISFLLLGIAMWAQDSSSSSMLIEFGIMTAGWAVSVIGLAAVMRRDVKVLQKQMENSENWQKSHDELHTQNSLIMGQLTELARGVDRRVERLETNEDERFKRRKGD